MFLAAGDALFDVFPSSQSSAGQRSLDAVVGGSPLNVALGLARLGRPAGLLSAVSTDPLGQQIADFLNTNGVSTDYLVRTDRHTTLAMIATDASGQPNYRFYTEGSADVGLDIADLPARREFDVISLGSYSSVLEPCASALAHFVEQASAHSFIAYDPNIRPSIEPDPEVWKATIRKLGAHAGFIKLSDEDAEFLEPSMSPKDYAKSLLKLGAPWVVLTRGADGASVFSNEHEFDVPGRTVSVVDTVGAGDTFHAALIHHLAEQGCLSRDRVAQADMHAAVSFAIKAAAITCSRQGADLPTLEEVNASE